MTFGRRDDRMSIFGSLRPEAGQTVTRAVVATYSLDLIAMLGLVLALGGDGETEFEASPLGLVRAFDRMRGRLLVLHQLSRVVAPSAHRSVLPLLDTMVHAVAANERKGSWHPKIALVRYSSDSGAEWRFWIGSRNLTGSTDRDAGLLLTTSKVKGARQVPDICGLAEDLLADARLTRAELAELRTARWLAPKGVSVRGIRWRRPGQIRNFLGTPLLARAERGCAVSPFIDKTGMREALKAGSQELGLLTTDAAASKCAPVPGVRFRTDSAPEPESPVCVEQQQDEVVGEFNDPPSTGIHAKLLAVSKGARAALMLGSANLTRRGLIGPNAEAVAILDVTDSTLTESLFDLVDSGLDLGMLDPEGANEDDTVRAERELDDIISRFLERRFSLTYSPDGLHLLLDSEGDDVLGLAQFEVSPFLDPNARLAIQPGTRSILLLADAPPTSEQTCLVNFHASSLERTDVCRTWVQALDVEGIDLDRRDRALLASYVGANRFRDWLRSLLDGVDGTSGQRWSDGGLAAPGEPAGRLAQLFTLETMLSAWARDHKAFESRVGGMMAMLESFTEVFASIPDDAERMAALDEIEEVRPFLQAVHDAIAAAT